MLSNIRAAYSVQCFGHRRQNYSMKDAEPRTGFITGLDLSEAFFQQAVEPILKEQFSNLRYGAALIGTGSEVLGFDTEMSSDHHWGPRVMLFVSPKDLAKHKAAVVETLREKLPRTFKGYSTSFSSPDDKG